MARMAAAGEATPEAVEKFKLFLQENYKKELYKAAEDEAPLTVDFRLLDKMDGELSRFLLEKPDEFFAIAKEAVDGIDLPGTVRIRFSNLGEGNMVNIRDLRSRHLAKMIGVEGTVRRASEIRPEIVAVDWKCVDCETMNRQLVRGTFVSRPFRCVGVVDGKACESKRFIEAGKVMFDTRWVTIEEPFELTEGEKPSQVNVELTEDLVSPDGRRMTDPGNRVKITGVLRDVARGKEGTTKLDFFLSANHLAPTDTSWEKLMISKADEEEIKKLSQDPQIYEKLVDSMASSLFGLRDIKESIILQLFGGVPRTLPDGTHFRGDIHILIIGDPASGKSQLLKLVPEIVPRGRYVSGKGVSVDYDDPVIYMDNGEIRTSLIGEVIDRYYREREHGVFVPVHGIMVPSFDPRTYKISWRPVTSVYRHTNYEPLRKLMLATGRELRVTGGHSIFVLEDGRIATKPAKDIREGEYVVLPSFIPPRKAGTKKINLIREMSRLPPVVRKNMVVMGEGGDRIPICDFKDFGKAGKYHLRCTHSKHTVPGEIVVDERLLWLLGFYTADGSLNEDSSKSRKVKFDVAEKEPHILDKIRSISEGLFNIKPRIYKRRASKSFNVYIYDKVIFHLFRDILKVGTSAEKKSAPMIAFNVTPRLQLEFIKGWFEGDYGVTISKTLMSDIMYLYYMNRSIATFERRLISRIVRFPGHESNVNREIFELKAPVAFKRFKNKHAYPPLSCFDFDFSRILGKSKYARFSPSSKKLIFSKFRNMLFERLALISDGSTTGDLNVRFGMGNIRSCRDYLKSLSSRGLVVKGKRGARNLYRLSSRGEALLGSHTEFEKILRSDFGFVRVLRNEPVKPTGKYVYDFSVAGCENFVAGFGGVVCHNTGAGLTATVTKDEQFMGGWVLEAGALVLTNKGLLAIDEFEKMNPDDMVAMHEALEQGTISIAKASIVATLPAKTSVLAGGNPKFSRFDPMRSVHEQVNIPPTLLSRFDLKFTLRDIPNAKDDKRIVDHVMRSRQEEQQTMPVISKDLIRKYIAYARDKSLPQMSADVSKRLREFYVKTRGRAEGGRAPVPMTLRQFEGLIRLSEASAKVRLSDVVQKQDAERAIRLMKASLKDLGSDLETGEIDVDKSEGGTTFSERSKITKILGMIDSLSGEKRDIVHVAKLKESAAKEGISDTEVEEIIDRLKREGVLFEPNPGYVQRP